MSVQVHAVEDSFESISHQIGNMIEEMTRRSYYRFSKSAAWEPPVNILEDDDHLYLCVELAGMIQDEIQVTATGSRLRIHGERPVPRAVDMQQAGCVVHMEINSGPFERIVDLPERVDPARMEAKLEAGMLWITVAKRALPTP